MLRLWLQVSLFSLLISPAAALAADYVYPYSDGIPLSSYISRRAAIADGLPEKSCLLIFSSDFYVRKKSGFDHFQQSSNLLYLTGIPDESVVLIITKERARLDGKEVREIAIIKEPTAQMALWNGNAINKKFVADSMGIKAVYDLAEIDRVLKEVAGQCGKIFVAPYTKGESAHSYYGTPLEIDLPYIHTLKSLYRGLPVEVSDCGIHKMREVKDEDEIRLLKKAVDISVEGHSQLMKNAVAGIREYEAEALMEYHFHKNGAENVGYNSIVGAGINGCVLHYSHNRALSKAGDMLLLDCGAEYHGYTADITRTIPLSGTFTEEQKAIYSIVLEAQKAGIEECRSGREFSAPNNAAKKTVAKGLIELGIISDEKDAARYFPHGTSHYLGIDVHDVGTFMALKAGNVITVEPGIYIPEGSPCDKKWWNIGIRIEDDILVTGGAPEVLSKALPKEIGQIENLVRQ